MKNRTAFLFLLINLFLISAYVAAQTQNPPAAEKTRDPLPLVQTAADIAGNLQYESLNRHVGIYIDDKSWADGVKDGDLGPFLQIQEAKPNRSAICFFSEAKDFVACVFFDGDKPYGAVVIHSNGKLTEKDIKAAYKNVTPDLLKKGQAKLNFEKTEVNADDGAALPAYVVSSGQ